MTLAGPLRLDLDGGGVRMAQAGGVIVVTQAPAAGYWRGYLQGEAEGGEDFGFRAPSDPKVAALSPLMSLPVQPQTRAPLCGSFLSQRHRATPGHSIAAAGALKSSPSATAGAKGG